MGLLLDTHVLVWLGADHARLRPNVREAIISGEHELHVSAVTAWEYADLERRGRFDGNTGFADLIEQLGLDLLDYPAGLWAMAKALPDLHRDPVDRMLIAHAIHSDLLLVTADETMRAYPVKSLWD